MNRPRVPARLWRTFRQIGDWERALDEQELDADLLAQRSSLMFGVYSEQGLRRVLQRYGTLARLEEKGLGPIDLRLSLEDPYLPRIELFSRAHGTRVIELTLSLTRGDKLGIARALEAPLLFLDGIALEHPGREFDWSRPPLPGQRRPGLSASNDVLELLLLMAFRVGAKGMALVPKHFHAAHAFARHFVFADGRMQGKFEALKGAARLRPLWLLAWALELGCVRDGRGEPVQLEPSPMIAPLTPELETVLHDPRWQRDRQAASRERYFLDRERLRASFPWQEMPARTPGDRLAQLIAGPEP